MNRATDQGHRPLIAIVGGGASGTLTAVQLLRRASGQRLALQVVLIDRYGRHGRGQAYSTGHEAHLLNTMAGQMSALPDDPDHLMRWARVPGETFLPRRDYGRYLCDTLEQARRQAQPTALLTRSSSEITSVGRTEAGRPLCLTGTGGWLEADVAVLALGAMTAGLPFGAPDSSRIISDPWRPGALDGVRDNKPVLIVGTGLTMIDLAVAISEQSPGSLIYAVSRHGLLPRPHPGRPGTGTGTAPALVPGLADWGAPARLTELMARVRAALAADPGHWHEVIGAIRPHVPQLWRGLSDDDKRLFLRHLARYWEVHRHLVPSPTGARLAALRKAGRLSVLTGRVTDVVEGVDRFSADQFRVRLDRGAGARELAAGWIINAAGAATDIRRTADPLVKDLLATGTARPDPFGLGLDATAHGALIDASGSVRDNVLTLGPPLRGLWYETTAIPEIRCQAAALAARIIADVRTRGQRDSAA